MRESIITLDGQDLTFQVHQVLQNFLQDGKGHGPITCHQVFTAVDPIHGRIQKSIISKAIAGKDWVFKDETGLTFPATI